MSYKKKQFKLAHEHLGTKLEKFQHLARFERRGRVEYLESRKISFDVDCGERDFIVLKTFLHCEIFVQLLWQQHKLNEISDRCNRFQLSRNFDRGSLERLSTPPSLLHSRASRDKLTVQLNGREIFEVDSNSRTRFHFYNDYWKLFRNILGCFEVCWAIFRELFTPKWPTF